MSDEQHFLRISPDQLSADALRGVIEAFVMREGTDYGDVEWSTEQKVAQVERALRRGEAVLVFDPLTESCTIASPDALRAPPDGIRG
jgi:uncharacterized protein YheU (UPF0270 family)